jgi:hypothetical protein
MARSSADCERTPDTMRQAVISWSSSHGISFQPVPRGSEAPHSPPGETLLGSGTTAPAQRRPHWKFTVLVPFGLVTMLDVIGCEPYFRQ